MAIKYDKSRIRLWKSGKKERPGIGINFGNATKKEINQIHKAVEVILALKYGKGIK